MKTIVNNRVFDFGLVSLHRPGCVLTPLLFDIFAAVINVAYTRLKADKDLMNPLVHLRKKKGAGGSNCRRASSGDAALGHGLR